MPTAPRDRRASAAATPARPRRDRPRIVVLGDLMLDVVLAPAQPLETGTDVPGRVAARPGRLGGHDRPLARPARGAVVARSCAVGRDAAGRALVDALREDGVVPRVTRVAGARTGRIGVLVAPGWRALVRRRPRRRRSRSAPDDLRGRRGSPGPTPLHLPVYSLLGEPLGLAGRRAVTLAREAGALVSVDLASIGPAAGARSARGPGAHRRGRPGPAVRDRRRGRGAARPLPTGGPARVRADGRRQARQQGRHGPGPRGRRSGSASRSRRSTSRATDTTGAGDAFDAGFLVGWFAARAAGRSLPASLQRAAPCGPSRGDDASSRRRGRSCRSPEARSAAQVAVEPGEDALVAVDPAVGAAGRRVDVVLVGIEDVLDRPARGGAGR